MAGLYGKCAGRGSGAGAAHCRIVVPMTSTPWLPADFRHPDRVELPTGHHLRPIRAEDAEIDLPAVRGSRERLWAMYGEAWGWPPEQMSLEQDREDLAHHEDEARRQVAFNYALLDAAETELVGCCYLDPATRAGYDVEVSWWVRDEYVGSPVEAALDAFLPDWIAGVWPFRQPAYVGRRISWTDYLARPRVDA